MCQHEFLRPKPHDPNVVADVYDSPAWRDFMGPATYPNTRLGFVFCIDAVPAFAEGSHSVKPGVFSNFSLPPTERGKPENMILHIVIPTKIKDPNVKKYFDFSATYELDDLFINGVEGVKIKIFTTTMDTPGRSELMGLLSGVCLLFSSLTHSLTHSLIICMCAGMQSAMSYQGCPVCLHSWTAGSTIAQTKCVYDGYRRFLSTNSRARGNNFRHGNNSYEYGCHPSHPSRACRQHTTILTSSCVCMCVQISGDTRPAQTSGQPDGS